MKALIWDISKLCNFAEKKVGRIIAIDYGQKRCGLAVTDELRMIAGPLATVPSSQLIDYLKKYLSVEKVDAFVVGKPVTLMNQPSESARFIEPFVVHLKRTFPDKEIFRMDERFTSSIASDAIMQTGASRKTRQDKALVDRVSAVIILQSFMETNRF
jgi:putative Holliday junction resolvase